MLARSALPQRLAGPALVLGAASSVQIGAAVATRLFGRIGPVSAVWLRLGFGAVMLIAVARARRGRRAARFDPRTVVLFGLVVAGMNTCFYQAIDRLPLGVAVTIEFLGPLGVAAAASRRRLDLLWVGLAACGVAALGSPTAHIDAIGAVFALAAGAGWAAFIVVGRRISTGGSLLDGLSIGVVIAAIVLTPFGIGFRHGPLLDARTLLLGVAVAALSSALPWVLELGALRHVSLTAYGVLVSLEPAIAAVVGAIGLSQRLGAAEIAATAAVVVASAGASLQAPVPEAPTS
ncbi:MAG TPA: EamA family transporter [Gaiellaceae bacterium]|nr:EamA family transporter [Gaiellaceae bacterium]